MDGEVAPGSASGRALAAALARRFARTPGWFVRAWAPGRYLAGGPHDEALILLDADGLDPQQLRQLMGALAWRAGHARLRLVLCVGEQAADTAPALQLAASALAQAWPVPVQTVVLAAAPPRLLAGVLPAAHPLEVALEQLREGVDWPPPARRQPLVRLVRGRRPHATLAIMAGCVAIYLVMLLGAAGAGAEAGEGELLAMGAGALPAFAAFGALAPELVAQGEPWRLGTAMFVHGGLVHIAMNLWALWVLGSFFERLVGWGPLVLVYAVSGLGASSASLLVQHSLSVGASGAIFGVFGLFAAVAWRPRGLVHPLLARALLHNAVVLFLLNLLLGLLIPQIDLAAHLGGFAIGFLLGVVLPLGPRTRPAPLAQLAVRAGAVLGAGVLLGGFALSLAGGIAYLRGRDLGAPVPTQLVQLGVMLELPARLRPHPVEQPLPAVVYERPYAALRLGIAVRPAALPLPAGGLPPHAVPQGDLAGPAAAPDGALQPFAAAGVERAEAGGRTWWRQRTRRLEHGVAVLLERYVTGLGDRLVQLEVEVLAAQAPRYRWLIERALASLRPLPAA